MTSDERSGLTRRAVLRGAAAAGAASLVAPSAGIAALTSGTPGVFSRWVGTVAGESAPIAARRRFALVGVEWPGPADATIELRTRIGAGAWCPWTVASILGHGPDRPGPEAPRQAGLFGEPVWTGPADYVQLRSSRAVRGARLHFVAPRPLTATPADATAAQARVAQAFPLAQPVLDAGPGQPQIIARSAWAQGHAPPSHVPLYGTVKLAFVHHSETPNGYGPGEVPSILLSIFDYHRYVRDYFDIAYNFAVDAFGRIWEARAGGIDLPIVGAHAGGYNEESTGMVVLGSFMDVVPSPAAIGALERLLAWKLALHGVPTLGRVTVEVDPDDAFYTRFAPGAHVSLPRIAGHRDGDETSCPGNAFYARLPSMRPQVAQLAGAPARATVAAPPAPVSAGTSVTLTGVVTDVTTGSPLAGAPIEIQQIGPPHSEQTIATLTTGAKGSWSYTFTPAQNMLVRALHQPAPAAVSDVAAVEVAPTVTLALVSPAPLVVSGTVSPAVHPVTVALYQVAHGRRRLIASKRVAAAGQFHARLRTKGPGRYVVIAQTPASAAYAGASSAPLTVTI